MNRFQFWILNLTSFLVALLFIAQIFETSRAEKADRQLRGLHVLIGEGQEYTTRWQQVAVRVYELSAQDPALKLLLARQRINVRPKAAPAASTSNPPPAAAPLAPAVTTPTTR